jgi:hypothetical protein
MKDLISVTWLTATVVLFACNNASAETFDFIIPLNIEQTQLDNNIGNDTWFSGPLSLDEVVQLQPNDSVTINIPFTGGGFVKIDDGFFNGDESIKITVDGEGGTGGFPDNKADFSYLFTGVEGEVLKNPITQADLGQITINPINGNVEFDKSIDLINGGTLKFSDIHLTLTNRNVNAWQFDKIGVGVDGDDVTIRKSVSAPEPSTIALLLSGGIFLLVKRSRKGITV